MFQIIGGRVFEAGRIVRMEICGYLDIWMVTYGANNWRESV